MVIQNTAKKKHDGSAKLAYTKSAELGVVFRFVIKRRVAC